MTDCARKALPTPEWPRQLRKPSAEGRRCVYPGVEMSDMTIEFDSVRVGYQDFMIFNALSGALIERLFPDSASPARTAAAGTQ